jgi:hypothetical protein
MLTRSWAAGQVETPASRAYSLYYRRIWTLPTMAFQRMSSQAPQDHCLETLRYWDLSISFLIYCLASHTRPRVVRPSPTLFFHPSFCWQVRALLDLR